MLIKGHINISLFHQCLPPRQQLWLHSGMTLRCPLNGDPAALLRRGTDVRACSKIRKFSLDTLNTFVLRFVTKDRHHPDVMLRGET